jgi:hypothetical protein
MRALEGAPKFTESDRSGRASGADRAARNASGVGLLQRQASPSRKAAKAAHLPFLTNLGGDLVPDAPGRLDRHPGLIVQTSIAEESLETATRFVKYMQADMKSDWAAATAGEGWSRGSHRRDVVSIPAFRDRVRRAHYAGAAWSDALLYGLLHG